jgi:hypothetical protein
MHEFLIIWKVVSMILNENKSLLHSYSSSEILAFVGLEDKIMRAIGFLLHAVKRDVSVVWASVVSAVKVTSI